MIECPTCLQSVEKLKSGSHVFPKWAMKLTKEDGSYASLDLKKNSEPKSARVQADPICDFWCATCEERFRDDDANGARFFRNREYLLREEKPDPNTGNVGVEIHRPEALNDLRSFIVSVFLRWDIYFGKVLKKPLLDIRFNFYANAHKNGELDDHNSSLILFRNTILSASHASPVKTRFGTRTCVMMVFCGYDIFLISDSRGPENNDFSRLVTDKEIVIPVSGGVQLPHVRKFAQTIQKIGSMKREKNREL